VRPPWMSKEVYQDMPKEIVSVHGYGRAGS